MDQWPLPFEKAEALWQLVEAQLQQGHIVAKALSEVRKQHPHILCYHYMDDILLAGKSPQLLQSAVKATVSSLATYGLQIAPEKIQQKAPWKYLGWKIAEHTIEPQNVQLQIDVKTLNDVQKLLGPINWVCTILGIDNVVLKPLFDLLKGDSNLNSPRYLTEEAKHSLQKVSILLQERQAYRIIEEIPVNLFVINQEKQPMGLLAQWLTSQNPHPLIMIEWVFLPHQFQKTIVTRVEMCSLLIRKGHECLLELTGKDPQIIYLPLTQDYLHWCLAQSPSLQVALEGYTGQLSVHFPSHKLFTFYSEISLISRPRLSDVPVTGKTFFTDGLGRTGKAVIVWYANNQWNHQIHKTVGSPEIVELYAVIQVFQQWSEPLNLITDSQYVANVVSRLERLWLKEIQTEPLFALFKQLWYLLRHRKTPYYVLHVQSHTTLPGFITEGNA